MPAYMKDLFIFILNTINDIMEELKLQKNNHAEFVKELVSFSPKITPSKNHKKMMYGFRYMFNICSSICSVY